MGKNLISTIFTILALARFFLSMVEWFPGLKPVTYESQIWCPTNRAHFMDDKNLCSAQKMVEIVHIPRCDTYIANTTVDV